MTAFAPRLFRSEYAAIAAFTLIYLLFPTANSTSDALGYAAWPETGSHHLLYDKLAIFVNQVLSGSKPATSLLLLKIMNALFAGGILWLAARILKLTTRYASVWPWIIVIGSTFAMMRFATENETYILPIFFSLYGSYWFLLFEKNGDRNQLILAFLFLAVALLFHQIHAFWFGAAFLSLVLNKNAPKRYLWVPVFATLVVLILYYITALQMEKEFIPFLLGETLSDTVQLIPGKDNFIFTPINFIRSFVQIHGNVYLLFTRFTLVQIALVSAGILFCLGIFYLTKTPVKKTERRSDIFMFRDMVLIAFVLQLAFAWYSVGNAEFMVMLPLLLFLYLAITLDIPKNILLYFGTGILIWNLATAILPNHFIDYENTATNVKKMKERDALFIAYHQTLLHNYYFHIYTDSLSRETDELWLKSHLLQSPADVADPKALKNTIDATLKNAIPVFTDCVNYPAQVSRKSMLDGDKNARFFADYDLKKYDSFSCFYGTVYIYRILPKIRVSGSDRPNSQSAPSGLRPNDKWCRQISRSGGNRVWP